MFSNRSVDQRQRFKASTGLQVVTGKPYDPCLIVIKGACDAKDKEGALSGLGIGGVNSVRQGKFIEVELAATDEAAARVSVERMCRDLLANTVIETYSYVIVPT